MSDEKDPTTHEQATLRTPRGIVAVDGKDGIELWFITSDVVPWGSEADGSDIEFVVDDETIVGFFLYDGFWTPGYGQLFSVERVQRWRWRQDSKP